MTATHHNNQHLDSDRHLFAQLSAGDESAYRALFDRHFPRLYSIMLSYTHTVPDAEDIVQSVFLTLWEKRQQLAQVEQPADWLFITARNKFLSRFRKLRVQENYQHWLTQVFEGETGTPEDQLITRQQGEQLHQAIALLPEKQREAFLLHRQEGLTYEQVGERMGIAKTTVKEHLQRANLQLRKSLPYFPALFFAWLSSH